MSLRLIRNLSVTIAFTSLITGSAALAVSPESPQAAGPSLAPSSSAATTVASDFAPRPDFLAATASCTASCSFGPDVTCDGSRCYAVDDPNGYCWSDVEGTKSCPQPPTISVSVFEEDCRNGTGPGVRADYTLRCTASGGTGSYTFSWMVCNPISAPGDNPNRCRVSTVGPVTVKCTVTSGGESVTKTRSLSGICF